MTTSESAKRIEDLVKQVDISSQKVEEIQKQILEEHENIQKFKDTPYQEKINEIEEVYKRIIIIIIIIIIFLINNNFFKKNYIYILAEKTTILS